MSDKITAKVKHLLALAYDAPSDEEGQTALLMAQKLMVKHNLSLSDVELSQKKEAIGESVGITAYRLVWWKENLATILGESFRCQVMRRRNAKRRTTQIVFFGYRSDAELCTKVYESAILYLEYRLSRLFSSIPKNDRKQYKKSYLLGFLAGLDQRFKVQCQSSEEFALMVQVPAEVIEEQSKQFGELDSKAANIPIETINLEGYFQGLEHAKNSKLLPEELLKEGV